MCVPLLSASPVPQCQNHPRSRTLPNVPIEPFGHVHLLAGTDRAAIAAIPRLAEIDTADRALFDLFDTFYYIRPRTALVSHLEQAAVFRSSLDQHFSFVRRITARFFEVDILPRLHGHQRSRSMPMVGSSDQHEVHLGRFEHFA